MAAGRVTSTASASECVMAVSPSSRPLRPGRRNVQDWHCSLLFLPLLCSTPPPPPPPPQTPSPCALLPLCRCPWVARGSTCGIHGGGASPACFNGSARRGTASGVSASVSEATLAWTALSTSIDTARPGVKTACGCSRGHSAHVCSFYIDRHSKSRSANGAPVHAGPTCTRLLPLPCTRQDKACLRYASPKCFMHVTAGRTSLVYWGEPALVARHAITRTPAALL